MGYYRTAQICMNGHCITDSYDAYPQYGQNFCDQCGAPTITECPSCKAKIRGDYYEEGVCVLGSFFKSPAYCHQCGAPYPWTQTALDAAADLIKEDEELPAEQQELLLASLPDIIAETPRTNLAAVRVKKALLTAGKFTAEALRQFAIDFGCELAKKQLGL